MKEIPVDKNNNSFHRESLWMEAYGLIRSQSDGRITGCLRPIARKRCTKLNPKNTCDGCMPREHLTNLTDHGWYYIVPKVNVFIFYAQPYSIPADAIAYIIEKAQAFGLYIHVGSAGEAWWNSGTYPIVVSRTPIPDHHYQWPPSGVIGTWVDVTCWKGQTDD